MPDRPDTGAMPLTQPHWAPIFDTGPHPEPMAPRADAKPAKEPAKVPAPTDVLLAERQWTPEPGPERVAVPAHPVAVPGQYQFLKIWKLVSVLCGVWVVAAAIGLGLYFWWFQSPDKTWVEVSVLMYVIVCVLSALLLSLPDQRPMLSATAIAVLTAPCAAGVAAAVLYGMFVFGWVSP